MDLKNIAEGLSAFPSVSRTDGNYHNSATARIFWMIPTMPSRIGPEALMTPERFKRAITSAYVFSEETCLELGAQADEMHRKIGMLIAHHRVKDAVFSRVTMPE
jgi:hypothetical protein